MSWDYTYSDSNKRHLCLEIAGVVYFISNMKGIDDRKIEVSTQYTIANVGSPIQSHLLAKVDTLKEAEKVVHEHIRISITEMQKIISNGYVLE